MSKPQQHHRIMPLLCILLLTSIYCSAQNKVGRADKIYFRSGYGFSVPVAESSDYLKPKFSTSVGGMLFLGKGGLFLYPQLGLNAYTYDETELDPGSVNKIANGRATTYLLGINLGYRTAVNRIGFYGFGGGGPGIILVPKVSNPDMGVITMKNISNTMMVMEAGIGGDYSFGNVLIFFEGAYTRALNKLEGQSYQAIPLNIGIRTNLTKVFFKK
jgi:hypothetical protein